MPFAGAFLLLAVSLIAAVPGARAAERLFVVSQGGQEILEYAAGTGSFVGVFADTTTVGFRLPGGIALRPSDGVLYVSSVSTDELWSYTTATGDAITPPVSTGLFSPGGVDFDAGGAFLYFTDAIDVDSETSDAVKRLEIGTGTVSTVGTNNQADFQGIAVNGADVFATDVELDRILRFAISGGPGSVEVSAGLAAPEALLFVSATQMLVADTGNDRVVEYLESGGSWSVNRVVLPASAGVSAPGGLALAPDGRLSVSGRSSGDVVLVDLATLAVTALVAPGTGGLTDPGDLAWSGNELLVASASGNAVFYFDAAGQPTGVRAEGISPALDAGIHVSDDGARLFVASIGGNDVLEFDASTGARVRTFTQACPNLPFPYDIELGADGRLYVSCILNSSVEHFDADTGAGLGSFVIAGTGGLSNPRSLSFGPEGDLFVADGSGAVLEFDGTTGAFSGTFVDANANGGGPLDAFGLRFHQGVLYATSLAHDEVMAFDAISGSFLSVFVAAGSGGLSAPRSLDFGSDGDLYVSDADAVRRYDGASGAFVEVFVPAGGGGLDVPFDLAFGAAAGAALPLLDGAGRALLFGALVAAAAGIPRRRARANRKTEVEQ